MFFSWWITPAAFYWFKIVKLHLSGRLCTAIIIYSLWFYSYLIGTGDGQPVEEWHKNLSGDGGHDGVWEAEEPELGSKPVSLSWCADDRDAWHEAGCEWHGNWHGCHLPPTQQEFGPAGLFAATEGLKEAESCCQQNDPYKNHIIPNRENGHLTPCPNHGFLLILSLPNLLFQIVL